MIVHHKLPKYTSYSLRIEELQWPTQRKQAFMQLDQKSRSNAPTCPIQAPRSHIQIPAREILKGFAITSCSGAGVCIMSNSDNVNFQIPIVPLSEHVPKMHWTARNHRNYVS